MKTVKRKIEYTTLTEEGKFRSSVSDYNDSGNLYKKIDYNSKGQITYQEKHQRYKTIRVYSNFCEGRSLELKVVDNSKRLIKEKKSYSYNNYEDDLMKKCVDKSIIKYWYDKNGRIKFIKERNNQNSCIKKYYYDEKEELSFIEEFNLPAKELSYRTLILKSPDSLCVAELTYRIKDDLMISMKTNVNIPGKNRIVNEEYLLETDRYKNQTIYDSNGRKIKFKLSEVQRKLYMEEIFSYHENTNYIKSIIQFSDNEGYSGGGKIITSIKEFEYEFHDN